MFLVLIPFSYLSTEIGYIWSKSVYIDNFNMLSVSNIKYRQKKLCDTLSFFSTRINVLFELRLQHLLSERNLIKFEKKENNFLSPFFLSSLFLLGVLSISCLILLIYMLNMFEYL